MSAKDLFYELANLTQLYLLQEYKLSERIFSEPESYAFFKQIATVQKKPPAPEPAPLNIKPQLNVPKELPPPLKEDKPIEQKPQPVVIEKEPSKVIKFEELEPPKPVDFSDLRAILQEKCPHIKIIEEIPERLKKQKTAHVVILHLNSTPLDKKFHGNLSHAIDTCLAPTSIVNAFKIDSSHRWEDFLNQPHLKVILIAQQELDALPKLFKHYSSTPQPLLGKIPVILLPELSLIYKEPNRKKALWSSLESLFSEAPDEKLS